MIWIGEIRQIGTQFGKELAGRIPAETRNCHQGQAKGLMGLQEAIDLGVDRCQIRVQALQSLQLKPQRPTGGR